MSPLSFRSSARAAAGALAGPAPPSEPWTARRVFVANLVVLGVVICFALVFRFAAALFVLFVGVTLGMAVRPGVERLRRLGVSRWAGALAIYLALGCVFAGVLILRSPSSPSSQHVAGARPASRPPDSRAAALVGQPHPAPDRRLPAEEPRGNRDRRDRRARHRYGGQLRRRRRKQRVTVAAVLLLGFTGRSREIAKCGPSRILPRSNGGAPSAPSSPTSNRRSARTSAANRSSVSSSVCSLS